MLTRGHTALIALAAFSAPLAGCLITTTSTGAGGAGGSTTTSAATYSNSSTKAASGTSGTSVSGATTSGTTASTGTSNPSCTDPTGTGLPESRCDQMANMPKTCPSTGMVPAAVAVCHRGFQIYRAGQWEELEACFEMIPATTDNTCGGSATGDIGTCVSGMYSHACNNADAVMTCDQTAAACAQANDPNFKTENCKADLAAFSTAGINAYISCINDPAHSGVACTNLHDTCFGVVTTY